MRARAEAAPDPATACVVDAHEQGRRRYGAGKTKTARERRGIILSRCRIGLIKKENDLVGAYTKAGFRPHSAKVNEVDAPNVIDGHFDGHASRTHIVSDLTYVRVGAKTTSWRISTGMLKTESQVD